MDKKRIEIIITIGLIIIFIFLLASSLKKIRQKFRSAQAPSVSSLQPSLPQISGQKKEEPARNKARVLNWARCPFSGKIYSTGKTEAVNLRLAGILWDTKNPQALINGRVVQEGDTIGDFVVIKILTDKVKLLHGDKYIEIKLEK